MRNVVAICLSILILSISVFAQSEKLSCPAIQITEPAAITIPGDTITFSVSVETEKVTSKLEYEWSVSAGTIVEGQGTSMIKVVTTPEMGDSEATAKIIIHNLPAVCANEIFGTAAIAPTIRCGLMEDYGTISTAIEKSMLDGVFMTLLDNSEYTAFFRLTNEKGETIKQTKSRINRIIKHAKYRGVNKNRFIFALDTSKTYPYLTTVYFVSKSKEFPDCEDCEIIKGADVK